MKESEIKKAVRENYGNIAKTENAGCCSQSKSQSKSQSCCSSSSAKMAKTISKDIGYSEQDMTSVPEGANLGLGCGNPVAIAGLQAGEVVLDLGSGAGFDCFLAAAKVGDRGRVIGVDMTPEMLDRARENARKGEYKNVEFRLGEIENLPVADGSVDVIISNCVINLAPDKQRVFSEAYRVMKPGGRMMVSDIVLLQPLPEFINESVKAYVGCIAGASLKTDYLAAIRKAGFKNVKVTDETVFPIDDMLNDPTAQAIIKDLKITPETIKEFAGSILSVKVSGIK